MTISIAEIQAANAAQAAQLAFDTAEEVYTTAQRDRMTIKEALHYAEMAARRMQDNLYAHTCNQVAQAGLAWVESLEEELAIALRNEEEAGQIVAAAYEALKA